MPWHRIKLNPVGDRFHTTTHYLWDPVEGPSTRGDLLARLYNQLGLGDNGYWEVAYGERVGYPPEEALEGLRAHYGSMRSLAAQALENLKPPERCQYCGCLRARYLGDLEYHKAVNGSTCPNIPF